MEEVGLGEMKQIYFNDYYYQLLFFFYHTSQIWMPSSSSKCLYHRRTSIFLLTYFSLSLRISVCVCVCVCVYISDYKRFNLIHTYDFNQGNVSARVNFCDFDYFVVVRVKKKYFDPIKSK